MAIKKLLLGFLFSALLLLVTEVRSKAQVLVATPAFHPRYQRVDTVPGKVLDINTEAVLYVTSEDSLVRSNRLSGSVAISSHVSQRALLTPTGVVLYGSGLLQIDQSEEIKLGFEYGWSPDFGRRVVDGRFGILRTSEGAYLRDFTARTNYLLNSSIGFADVAENGSVVFTTNMDATNTAVQWYNKGEIKTLSVMSVANSHVETDGTNVLWSIPQFPFGSVQLQTPAGVVLLATNTFVTDNPTPLSSSRKSLTAMKGGYVVFPRWDPPVMGMYNLWRRSPDGLISKLTPSPALVLAMRTDGSVLVLSGMGRTQPCIYYIPPSGPAKLISYDFGATYFASGSEFYAYSPTSGGAALFLVDVEGQPFGLTSSVFHPETAILSYSILASENGSFALERTGDFENWFSIATNAVTGLAWPDFEVSTQPGFFRLRKL